MLGNNRDYKTTDRRARTQLAKHAARMNELIAQGMPKEQASTQAMQELETPKGKARIKQNQWGNWYGYIGRRRVIAFNNTIPGYGMEQEAKDWLAKQEAK